MKPEIKNLFKLKHFFKLVNLSDSCVTYNLTKPSQMLMKNVHMNWLQYVYAKTHKQMRVYINDSFKKLPLVAPVFGSIEQSIQDYNEDDLLEYNFKSNSCLEKSGLQLDLVLPKQDAMQYFIKWQRYRKYWWSSISTTPSLFAVDDIKYEGKTANVNIVARLPCGEHQVENVAINFEENEKSSRLSCCISLENALNILLLDGLNNNTKEEYLRLHRKIAPYKVSFALDFTETDNKDSLQELATMLCHKLETNKISTWLPEFTLSTELQIKENLHLGVTYTAILSDDTLNNGIFHLMNSSTMLGEQVHVADFHKYAAIIFDK